MSNTAQRNERGEIKKKVANPISKQQWKNTPSFVIFLVVSKKQKVRGVGIRI